MWSRGFELATFRLQVTPSPELSWPCLPVCGCGSVCICAGRVIRNKEERLGRVGSRCSLNSWVLLCVLWKTDKGSCDPGLILPLQCQGGNCYCDEFEACSGIVYLYMYSMQLYVQNVPTCFKTYLHGISITCGPMVMPEDACDFNPVWMRHVCNL